MIRFINKKKAMNELKKVWTAHQNLNANTDPAVVFRGKMDLED